MKRNTMNKTKPRPAERKAKTAGPRSKPGEAGCPGSSYYHISSVADRFHIHPQTLRLYEREGLLKPSRSCGNTRLYSDEDLKRLEIILNLVRDLGVNLAGVEVILNMRAKIERIEAEVQASGREEEFEARRQSLVRVSSSQIVKVDKSE